jgi:hypothetical protein
VCLPKDIRQGHFAVQIILDDPEQSQFLISARGIAAIYTSAAGWCELRRIEIRGRTWLNWLYPMPF